MSKLKVIPHRLRLVMLIKKYSRSSEVSSCKQVEINIMSPLIMDTERKNTSRVNSSKQVQTSSMVYNAEGRVSSEYLDTLYNGKTSVEYKGSDRVISNDKSYLDNRMTW